MLLYQDRNTIEEEFKKRGARLSYENEYYSRGTKASYFTKRDFTKSGTPTEAVTKVIHHRGNVKDLIKYVAEEKRTGTDENLFTAEGNPLTKKNLKELENFWNERNRKDTRQNSRHSTHIILSTKEKPTRANIKKFKSVVSEIAGNHFTSNGFDSFFAIHTDKPHLHAHLVVHNKNLLTNKKIRFSVYREIYALRKNFADLLNNKGWHYSSTLRKDSLQVRDGLDEQKKNQNYILHKVEQSLGQDARRWAKKQFILKFSKNESKSKQAKYNLALIRDLDSEKNVKVIMAEVEKYKAQKRKWDIKQTLQKQYPKTSQKTINRYVDTLFATQDRLARSYTTKNKKSVDQYNSVTNMVEKITEIDMTSQFASFQRSLDKQAQRASEVKDFNTYGDIGKLYLKQLHQNLDYAKTDKQKGFIATKISELKDGIVDQDEFDHFRQSNLEKNSRPYQLFFAKRALAMKQKISKDAGVSITQVTEVENLFTLYCARRGVDAVYANRSLNSALNRYVDVLKSGNHERIWHFSHSIQKQLGVAPEQKYEMQAKSKKSSPSPSF